MTINDWNWEIYMRSEKLRQTALILDQSQLCSSIRSRDIRKTRGILGLKMAKRITFLK